MAALLLAAGCASDLAGSTYSRDGARAQQAVYHGTLTRVEQVKIEGTDGALGGIGLDHPVNFMSMHSDAYKRMTDVDALAAIEDKINAEPSTYIPKAKLRAALKGIRNGDIILFNTNIDGLDISHCAIALVEEGKPVRFIHASTGAMKVIVEAKTLEEYVMGRKSATGIEVYRVR